MIISKNYLKFIILFFCVTLIWLLGKYIHLDMVTVEDLLRKFPLLLSGVIFISLYVVCTFFLWFSKDLFRFVSAVLFGAYISTLFVWIAEIINAFILFYLARYLGSDFVEKRFALRHESLNMRLKNISFFWLFMFRVVPLVPFRFLDLACGLTNMNFKKYITAAVFGSVLRIFWLQYVLAGVGMGIFKDPYALTEYLKGNKFMLFFTSIYILFVIIVGIKIKEKHA